MRSPRRSTTQVTRPPHDAPDTALVAAARTDSTQFAALFDRYWDPVFRFCYYRIGNWHDAEDAASKVFLNAFNGLPGYRNDPHELALKGWLFTIARNVVANRARDDRSQTTLPLDAIADRVSPEPSPEETAISADAHQQIRALLRQLPANQRELMELRIAGLSTAEIGQVLGMSAGAVRTAQFRAMEILRQHNRAQTGSTIEVSHD